MTGPKAAITGIRNVWIRVKRPEDLSAKMKQYARLGCSIVIPMGAGGIIVSQMQVNEDDTHRRESRQRESDPRTCYKISGRNNRAYRRTHDSGFAAMARSQPGSISPETGLALDWGTIPPKPLWQANVGIGYSSMAVVAGKLYTQGWNWRSGSDTVVCLNAVTGNSSGIILISPGPASGWMSGVGMCRNSWDRVPPQRSMVAVSIRWRRWASLLFRSRQREGHLATPVRQRSRGEYP